MDINKIRTGHQALAAKYHWMIPLIVPLLAGYFGIDQYEMYEKRQAAAAVPAPTEVVVTVAAPAAAGPTHSHITVVGKETIKQLIKNAVDAAVEKQDAKNAAKFPAKETWQ